MPAPISFFFQIAFWVGQYVVAHIIVTRAGAWAHAILVWAAVEVFEEVVEVAHQVTEEFVEVAHQVAVEGVVRCAPLFFPFSPFWRR